MQGIEKVRPEKISVTFLDFDPENPRFLGAETSDEAAVKRMMEQENLDELVGSIGNQGFFPGEPLLISRNPNAPDRYIVVEGNRRLAALRALSGAIPKSRLTNSVAQLVSQALFKPTEVDCFVFEERRDILKYLGFRHISGPKRWDPLAKARYLADLVRNFYSDLSLDAQLRAVARDIGSRHDYVAQLLTALNLYDRAKARNFYDLQRVDANDVSFSLLSTALSYSNIVSFLDLTSRGVVIVDSINDAHAKELLSWMFAQNQTGDTVLGESRELKRLAAVVASPRAVAELRKTESLEQAYVFTSGPTEAFNKLLGEIESNIASSIGLLSGDFHPDEGHLSVAERINVNSENLVLLIQKAIRRSRRQNQTESVNSNG
jgi:ParB-like nuclease domain